MNCATQQIARMQSACRDFDVKLLALRAAEAAIEATTHEHASRDVCSICMAQRVRRDRARAEFTTAAEVLRAQFGPLA